MHRLTLMLATATGLFVAGAASAQDAHWYVQGNAGVGFESRLQGSPERRTDPGWGVGGAAGRDFGNGWRADGEIVYFSADNNRGQTGSTDVLAGFANVYYDFLHDTAWRPFIGVGVGGARVQSQGEGSDAGFAYQAKVGVDHPFTDRLTGEVAYRYIGVTDVKAGSGLSRFYGDYHTHAVTVGLRYAFGR